MEAARRSAVVKVPVQEAHLLWLGFTGQPTSTPGSASSGTLTSAGLSEKSETGRVYFSEDSPGATRVIMELRFNPQAVKDANRSDDWVARRIDLYLQRFSEYVGRQLGA